MDTSQLTYNDLSVNMSENFSKLSALKQEFEVIIKELMNNEQNFEILEAHNHSQKQKDYSTNDEEISKYIKGLDYKPTLLLKKILNNVAPQAKQQNHFKKISEKSGNFTYRGINRIKDLDIKI